MKTNKNIPLSTQWPMNKTDYPHIGTVRARALSRLVMLVVILCASVPVDALAAPLQVTSADPASAPQSTISLDVNISGSGFDSSAKVRFLVTGTAETGGISVRDVRVLSSKKLVAVIDIAENATIDKFDIEVELSSGRKGKGTTLFTVLRKPNAEANNCVGAEASFVFSKKEPGTVRRDFYIANDVASCQRFIFSVGAGSYDRYVSFRALNGEGRLVTTNGLKNLLLVTFPFGADMTVGVVTTRVVFDPTQSGWIDNGYFELFSDGRRLAYVTSDEPGEGSWVRRLRVLDDIETCSGCSYDAGALLAERVGLNDRLASPRWSTDGSTLWLEDRRGDPYRPYLSTVPSSPPTSGLHAPQIVIDGGSLSSELGILGLRARASGEVLAYTSRVGSGCRELVVVDTSTCSNGACARVNSGTTRVITPRSTASIQTADAALLALLLEGAKESKNGSCSLTGKIIRVLDTGTTVQSSEIATGIWPAPK